MPDLPVLNESGTGYLGQGNVWGGRVFLAATNFHTPQGLAAVRDETGAYHVGLDGNPAYVDRYQDAAGFYEGLAAVRDNRGWFHIRADGTPVHERRFRWSGNFQGGRCAVQDSLGFFHVDARGKDAYPRRFRYVGDFRYGVAVAHGPEGAVHIREDGEPLNGVAYLHAEPYHKGHAVVADPRGCFHVDRSGRPIHPFRFQAAEPFYNGVALCRGLDGQQVRLRLNGTWTRVADDIEPVPLDEVRRFAEGSGRVGLFVRHAERAAITPATPNWGNDVLLTARGVADAEALGQKLAGVSRLALWSSPVERCRQTAEAVARGADIMADRVEAHTHLGNPGIYFDPTSRPPDLLRTDFHAFADAYLDTGVAEGMRPVPEASEELLAFLEQKMADADCTVFVTHDFFAAALMSYLGLKAPHRDDWCGYLEGVCILKDCGGRARFRRILGQTEERQC